MISIEEKRKLLNNLKINSLNDYTIECIMLYANISTEIFDINHEILIERLSCNLKSDINISQNHTIFSNALAGFNHKLRQIFISSKVTNKQHTLSLILHELDHASTLQNISQEDKYRYLDIYLQRLSNTFPILIKIPFLATIIRNNFLKSTAFSSGFNNPLAGKALGVNLNLFKEGFTVYKQSKYEQYLHLTDKITMKDNPYKTEMKVAQLIIDIIGENTVMQLEQKNDVLSLKAIFEKITQKQIYFKDLIQQLNNARIASNRTLENQRKLDVTLKKISLCKKAYDYGINLSEGNFSVEQIQNLIISYEKKLYTKKQITIHTRPNPESDIKSKDYKSSSNKDLPFCSK